MSAAPLLGARRSEAGFLLIRELELDGWEIAIVGRRQGGVSVTARRGPLELPPFIGESLAAVAIPLLEAARRALRGASPFAKEI